MYLATQQQRADHWYIGKRKNESAKDGEENSQRHRTEHLAFNPHQGHQRNIHYHNHDFTERSTLPDARS